MTRWSLEVKVGFRMRRAVFVRCIQAKTERVSQFTEERFMLILKCYCVYNHDDRRQHGATSR